MLLRCTCPPAGGVRGGCPRARPACRQQQPAGHGAAWWVGQGAPGRRGHLAQQCRRGGGLERQGTARQPASCAVPPTQPPPPGDCCACGSLWPSATGRRCHLRMPPRCPWCRRGDGQAPAGRCGGGGGGASCGHQRGGLAAGLPAGGGADEGAARGGRPGAAVPHLQLWVQPLGRQGGGDVWGWGCEEGRIGDGALGPHASFARADVLQRGALWALLGSKAARGPAGPPGMFLRASAY